MNQRARIKVHPVTSRPNTKLDKLEPSLHVPKPVKSGNKAAQRHHLTRNGSREKATAIQHPPMDVKDLRNNLQENSDCCQSTDAGCLTDAHHYCRPREQPPSDYLVTATEDTRVNRNAISAVDDNDLPAATTNYYGQCRDGHVFQVVTPIIELRADVAGDIRQAAPPTLASLGTARLITDVCGSPDIDTTSAEMEIKTTGIYSAENDNKLLPESADSKKSGANDDAERSYTISQQKNWQIDTAVSETSINSEKCRVDTSIAKVEINKCPASEEAGIKIGQSSEIIISAEDSKNAARTHPFSQPGRRQKKREAAKCINRRKKQTGTAKETRRLKEEMDSAQQTAQQTANRSKKPEERAPNAMITTPTTPIDGHTRSR